MKWTTCDECIPIVDKLFSLWVRAATPVVWKLSAFR